MADKLTLPDPGPRRWWSVELVKNVAKDPIKVTLMESVVANRKGLSTRLGYARTIATPKKVAEAADLVLVQVGDYESVVGEFNTEGLD